MPLLTLRDVRLRFAGPPLLGEANLQIEPGERVGLLGRNGAGKSCLLQILSGELEPDAGEVVRVQGLETARLPQEVPQDLAGSVFDVVAGGLRQQIDALAEYQRLSARFAAEGGRALRDQLDQLHRRLDAQGAWQWQQQVETVLSQMQLDPRAETAPMSAGMKRRVMLARALAGRPDVLLLDEPTNHLDVRAICWLEDFLARYEGTLVLVTHDRMLIRRLATRIVELDRGRLLSWDCGYDTYVERKASALEAEARQNALFDKRLAQEEAWLRRGIMARRTRNEGKVRALVKMRQERAERRSLSGPARIQIQEAERSGRLVAEARGVTFAYGDRPVIRDLDTLVLRGDRVGILGPNGSGKTTLLKLLLGQLKPLQGRVRLGTRLEVAYFDQLHAQLNDEKTVRDNVADGADVLVIDGKRRHVLGYLEDFLFARGRAQSPVKFLSGGERNRLLLARLFTKPANLLVMDEPTNDLDLETLELLEERLLDFEGTLLLVSHDREFLNHVVTSTLVLEGDGRVKEYAGGWDDYLAQRKPPEPPEAPAEKPSKRTQRKAEKPRRPDRLSYQEQRELAALPARIEGIEAQLDRLHRTTADPAFYRQGGEQIAQTMAELKSLERALIAAYARWESLERRTG